LLEVATVEEINLEKLSILRGLVSLIKNGEGSLKDLFEKKAEASEETKDAVGKSKDDLAKLLANKKVREQIQAKEKETEGLALDSDKYLSLRKEIEELEKQIVK
jgi:hypothetical protein